MASEEKEKIKAKEKKLQKKREEIIKLKKEIDEYQKKIDNLWEKIDEHRDRLWGKLRSLIIYDLPEYEQALKNKKESLEQKEKKEKLSELEKQSLEKLGDLIKFFEKLKNFYDNLLEPGLRNLEKFRNLFYIKLGGLKTKNPFDILKNPLDIMIKLDKDRVLELGQKITGIIDTIKKDIQILPHLMIKSYNLRKECDKLKKDCQKKYKEYLKLSKKS